jgi:hypothetical protein
LNGIFAVAVLVDAVARDIDGAGVDSVICVIAVAFCDREPVVIVVGRNEWAA